MANTKINDLAAQANPTGNMQLETDIGGSTANKIILGDNPADTFTTTSKTIMGAMNELNKSNAQMYWVESNGSDSETGLNDMHPFLTHQKGIDTAALQSPGALNQFVIKTNDAGEYILSTALNYTHEYIHIDAYNAKFQINDIINLKQNTSLRIKHITVQELPFQTRGIVKGIGSGNGIAYINGDSYKSISVGTRAISVLEGTALSQIEEVNIITNSQFAYIANGAYLAHSGKNVNGDIQIADTGGFIYVNIVGNYTGNIIIGDTANAQVRLDIGGDFNGNINTSATTPGAAVIIRCGRRTGGTNSGLGTVKIYDFYTLDLPNGSAATTQSAGDNSTKIATTAYVDNGIVPIVDTLTISSPGQTAFTLSQTPNSNASVNVYLNGQRSTTYTLVGVSLTWTGVTLATSDELIAWYGSAGTSSDKYIFLAATNYDSNDTGYRGQAIAGTGSQYFTFVIPSDFNSFVINPRFIVTARSGVTGVDIDLSSTYAGNGEVKNTHTESDTTSTYDFSVADTFYTIDLSGILSSVSAGDRIGIYFDNKGIGTTLDVYGIEYTYN